MGKSSKNVSTTDKYIQYLLALFAAFGTLAGFHDVLDSALADLAALTAVTGFPQDCNLIGSAHIPAEIHAPIGPSPRPSFHFHGRVWEWD